MEEEDKKAFDWRSPAMDLAQEVDTLRKYKDAADRVLGAHLNVSIEEVNDLIWQTILEGQNGG